MSNQTLKDWAIEEELAKIFNIDKNIMLEKKIEEEKRKSMPRRSLRILNNEVNKLYNNFLESIEEITIRKRVQN